LSTAACGNAYGLRQPHPLVRSDENGRQRDTQRTIPSSSLSWLTGLVAEPTTWLSRRCLGQSIAPRYNVPVQRKRSPNDRIAEQLDYWTLAELRYHIRRFLRTREEAARAAGIEPQQYQLLLQVKGMQGRQPPTIGALAERLQLRHHSTVELIDRLVDRGMLVRRTGGQDRREVLVELRPSGEAILRRLALYSLRELETEGPALVSALRRLIATSKATRRPINSTAVPPFGPIRRRRQDAPRRRDEHGGSGQ
jgi:DNA-binding MarR family transcriptional regulator